MRLVAIALTAAFSLQTCSVEKKSLSPMAACQLLSSGRNKHVGETITFPGDYASDHIERAVIWPLGCRYGIGVGSITPDSEKLIDKFDTFPFRANAVVEAIYTGTIVLGERNGMQFGNDDGVRLDVTHVSHPVPKLREPQL